MKNALVAIMITGTLIVLFVIPMTHQTPPPQESEELIRTAETHPLMILNAAEGFVRAEICSSYGLGKVRGVRADSLVTEGKGKWKVRGTWKEVHWECIVYASPQGLRGKRFRAGADLTRKDNGS